MDSFLEVLRSPECPSLENKGTAEADGTGHEKVTRPKEEDVSPTLNIDEDGNLIDDPGIQGRRTGH